MQSKFGFEASNPQSAIAQVPHQSLQVSSVHASTVSTGSRLRDLTTYDTEWIMRTVTITGTRETGHKSLAEYADLFEQHLGPFVPAAHFYLGGAVGIDSLALLWLADRTTAAITVVAPGTLNQQPAEAREAVARARGRITEIVELTAAELRSPAYHARNRWMVDRTSMTIGFPHATEPSTGTWQTINYTAEQGKPRLIVPV
ncbi:DNA-processing protein DprA [Streptomyces sp. McG3]|uniref:DNA-processing protein DprA n=1 Tax=Streptomyces sp. McG3 TaxID=2725483 RepID=UPI0027E4758A|nr:DNA-processing protein DprA [Streptomyces sp. McG3]